MNKYAQTAVLAAQEVKLGKTPLEAWNNASKKIFIPGSPSQLKGCPKNTFLGLYGGNGKNAEYALKALEYLRKYGSSIKEIELWNIVTENSGKAYNSQMHVVKILFDEKYI